MNIQQTPAWLDAYRPNVVKRDVTLVVPQGIGDIFWCYQKLAPYFHEIKFRVPTSSMWSKDIQLRSAAWVQLFPKCTGVDFINQPYNPNAEPMRVTDLLAEYDKGKREFEYAVNAPLERGVRLEEIDADSLIEWRVPVRLSRNPLRQPPSEPYIVIYLSGNTADAVSKGIWTVNDWVNFVTKFWVERNLRYPAVVIGAEYDRAIVEVLAKMIRKNGIREAVWIGADPENVLDLIQGARFFMGYQSGMGIMADNLGVPSLMMYFDWLDKMKYSWCQPGHALKKFYAACFKERPEAVLELVKPLEV